MLLDAPPNAPRSIISISVESNADDARVGLDHLVLLANSASRKENTDQRVEKEVERDREKELLPCSESAGCDWTPPVSSDSLSRRRDAPEPQSVGATTDMAMDQ